MTSALTSALASTRIPGGTWTWRRTALVLLVVLAPVLGLGFADRRSLRLVDIVRFDGIVVSPALLISAIACYAAWRLNPRPGLAWVSFVVTLLGWQGLMLTAAQAIRYPAHLQALWTLAADVTVALVVLTCSLLSMRVELRPDPAAAGFVVGVVVALPRMVWVTAAPDLGQRLPHALVAIGFSTVVIVSTLVFVRVSSLPPWARLRLGVAAPLIGGAHLTLYLSHSWAGQAIAIVGDTLGAVAVLTTSLALLLTELDVDETRQSTLNDELEDAKRGIREQRAQFHEINSTIAGVSSASRLLHSTHPMTDQRRRLLEDMILAELGRLERLMAETTGRPPEHRTIDLDDTIRTLVLSQEARGHTVRWKPSGHRVTGQPDAIAEVINILLDNAARHGNATAEVDVRRTADAVEIVVRDDGPGVDESVRKRLFTWEARGPGSRGQGIGLHTAHELMKRQGGYLALRDGARGGATFVLGLPLDHGGGGARQGSS